MSEEAKRVADEMAASMMTLPGLLLLLWALYKIDVWNSATSVVIRIHLFPRWW